MISRLNFFVLFLALLLLTSGYAVHAATETQVIIQTEDVINRYLLANQIFSLPAPNGQTISQIYAGTGSAEDKVRKVEVAVCGEETTMTQEAMAAWRLCAQAIDFIMAELHFWHREYDWVNAYTYAVMYHTDSLSTPPSRAAYHGGTGPLHQLVQTEHVKNYLNDQGMGVFTGLGWLKQQGVIQQHYCTALETPFDPGKWCKTINLYERVMQVAQAVVDGTNTFRSHRSDSPFLSRSAAGRAAAAHAHGDALLRFSRIFEANDLVSRLFGVTVTGNPINWDSPNNIFPASSDFFQHLGVMLHINDWVVPQVFKSLSPVWADTFFTNYFHSQYPIADIAGNTYIPSHIQTLWGADKVYTGCGIASDAFITNPATGKTVGPRGEYLSDALTTIGPGLYWLLKQSGDMSRAQQVLDITSQSLTALQQELPSWENEACNTSRIYGNTPKNHLMIALRTYGYLYYTYMGMQRMLLSSFGPRPILPPPMQSQSLFRVGNSLYQTYWRGDLGYFRTIPIENDTIQWAKANPWSAPVSVTTLPGSGPLQEQTDYRLGATLHQTIWRNDLAYNRTVPITGNTINWHLATAWSNPIPLANSGMPGTGSVQISMVNVLPSVLIQGVWQNNIGYTRSVPLVADTPQWSCISAGSCPWSVVALNQLPGNGEPQAQADIWVGSTLLQSLWRGDQGFTRTIPAPDGNPQWANASPWSGPQHVDGFAPGYPKPTLAPPPTPTPSPTPTPIPGDLNGDRHVDYLDLQQSPFHTPITHPINLYNSLARHFGR